MSRYRAFVILILDVLTIFLCNFLTMLPYLLGQDIRLLNLVLHIGLLTVCVLLFQVCLKTYDTLWRYAESREYLTLLEGMGLGFTLYSVVNLLLGTSRIWISSALTGTALALLVRLSSRRWMIGFTGATARTASLTTRRKSSKNASTASLCSGRSTRWRKSSPTRPSRTSFSPSRISRPSGGRRF